MTTTTQEVKILKKDIAQIKNMLADQLDETPSNGASKTLFTKEDLQRVANETGKGVRTFLADKQKKAGEAKAACESTIKSRPFTSAAVAFAGGMVLSALMKR